MLDIKKLLRNSFFHCGQINWIHCLVTSLRRCKFLHFTLGQIHCHTQAQLDHKQHQHYTDDCNKRTQKIPESEMLTYRKMLKIHWAVKMKKCKCFELGWETKQTNIRKIIFLPLYEKRNWSMWQLDIFVESDNKITK